LDGVGAALFVDNYHGDAQLYHNRNGTFTDVTTSMGINGPREGFSCWAWDNDNGGWLDIFMEMGGVTNGNKYHYRSLDWKPIPLPK